MKLLIIILFLSIQIVFADYTVNSPGVPGSDKQMLFNDNGGWGACSYINYDKIAETFILTTVNGIDYTPGSDTDTDLITVNVTGTPKIWWDEATDSFEMNKSLTVPGGSLKIGSHVITENTETNDSGFEVVGTFHIKAHDSGIAGSIEFHEGTEPVSPLMPDAHRFWVDTSHNIQWQDHEGTSRMLHAAGGDAPGQWTLTGNDLSYTAGDVSIGANVFFADVSNGSINLGSAVTGTDRLNVFSPTSGVQTGIASFYDSSSNIKLRIRDQWTASSIPPRIESESTLGFALNTTNNAPFIWYVNGTSNEKMRLTSTGLGVGVTIPAYKLDVLGTINASTGIKVNGIDVLTSYTETDPMFSAWDKSAGISITESQISDLAHFSSAVEIDTPEIHNSLGDLKIQPDVEGDVILFGDTDVDNAASGKMLYIRRQAVEGNDYMRFYISANQKGYIHTTADLTMQGQTDFTIYSVTEDVIFKVGDNAGVKKFYFKDSDSNDIATINSNGEAYFAGNIGIGINNPSEKLQIESGKLWAKGATSTDGIVIGTDLTSNNSAHLNWQSSGLSIHSWGRTYGEQLFIDGDSSNIGIGTTAPGLPLEVRSADDNQMFAFDSRAQAQGVGGGIAFGGKYTDAGAEAMAGRIGTKKTNGTSGHVGFDMVFETQDSVGSITERMILTSDGKVGIGDVVPSRTLDVNGSARIREELSADANVVIGGNLGIGDTTPNFKIDLYDNRTSGIKRSARFITDGDHVDARGLYVVAGEYTESGTNYWFEAYDGDQGINTGGLRSVAGTFAVYDASDRRLKQNIVDTYTVGKGIILGLKVRDFEWRSNPGRTVTGLIAQEVLEVYPDAVGKPDTETGMYAISRAVLIPHLIKHNQEQQAEIDALESRLTKIEAKLQALGSLK